MPLLQPSPPSPAAFAGYTSSTSLLTGYVSVENFRDTNLNAFDVVLRDLSGTVNVTVPPNGVYSVDVSGAVNLTFAPPPAPQINVAIPLPTWAITAGGGAETWVLGSATTRRRRSSVQSGSTRSRWPTRPPAR